MLYIVNITANFQVVHLSSNERIEHIYFISRYLIVR